MSEEHSEGGDIPVENEETIYGTQHENYNDQADFQYEDLRDSQFYLGSGAIEPSQFDQRTPLPAPAKKFAGVIRRRFVLSPQQPIFSTGQTSCQPPGTRHQPQFEEGPKTIHTVRYGFPEQSPNPVKPSFIKKQNAVDSRMRQKLPATTHLLGTEHITPAHKQFLDSVDVQKSLLESLRPCIVNNEYLDIGKTGLVRMKYRIANRSEQAGFEDACRVLSNYSLTLLHNTSEFDDVPMRIKDLGYSFFLNLAATLQKESRKKEPKTLNEDYFVKPTFQLISMEFNGSTPFKEFAIVSMHNREPLGTCLSRNISFIIRCVLAQVFHGRIAHQKFTFRTTKRGNKEFTTLPEYVLNFIVEFCLISFGFPPQIRIPGYTLENLCESDSRMSTRLGGTYEEKLNNFLKLSNDVQNFAEIVKQKTQRTLSDVRSLSLETATVRIGGHDITIAKFEENSQMNRPSVT